MICVDREVVYAFDLVAEVVNAMLNHAQFQVVCWPFLLCVCQVSTVEPKGLPAVTLTAELFQRPTDALE